MPFLVFENGSTTSDIINQIPSIIGVEKYYEISISENVISMKKDSDLKSLGQLWCKALVYFFIAIQIQIIKSRSFERLKDYVSICNIKG
jgi:hypothetical protein